MTESTHSLSWPARISLNWKMLLRWILHLWVRVKVLPDAEGRTGVPHGNAVVYVMADYALSSVLILDKACEDLGIDQPLFPVNGLVSSERRAYAVLRRLKGLFIRRPSTRRASETLGRLIEHSYENPDSDIRLVPVTVLVGRAPDKETGVAKVLFAEDWEVAGRFRRLLSTLVNGRDTVVQFSRPISLRQMADEDIGAARSVRKVSRILRTHFRRVRTAMIGPDLSHRRTVVDSVVKSPSVREAIRDKVRRDSITEQKAEKLARKYALEIAANYNYSFVRIAFFIIEWFLGKVFNDIEVLNFDRYKQTALGHEIIYVPCHRSHADYLLLSFLLYMRGLAVPHIAAGMNLNLPVAGSLIRMGGAFFLRRSFKSQKLYSAVFSEYVSTIQTQGVPLEYFIEGTRSRTGRLLQPKGGMLAMSVRSYLRSPVLPIMFQPLYIGYEQLLEGSVYTHELSGAEKKKETLWDVFRSLKLLSRNYGTPRVSFGEPIFLDALLDTHDPDWRASTAGNGEKPSWMTPCINELGDQIMRSINASADVNAVNLLATVLLATPRHALGENELVEQLMLYRTLLAQGPYGERITLTVNQPDAIISYCDSLGLLERSAHTLGDIIRLAPEHAVGLTYFRNNAAHLFAVPSLIASCFLRRRSINREHLYRVTRDIFPFLRAELYLPTGVEAFDAALEMNLDLMRELGLLEFSEDGSTILRTQGGSREAGQMNLLARSLLPTLERYYITIAVLVKNGSGTLSRAQTEKLCILTAQRISLLQEFEAPEFYDRSLFRQFIAELRNQEVLVGNKDGLLEFGEQLDRMSEDSRFFLEKGIRHGIIQVAPQALANGED